MARDAMIAAPQDREAAMLAQDCRAATARLALVAGRADIAEIEAAGTLQQIAADRRHVAHLRRGAGKERLGCNRIATAELGVVGEVGHAHQRADVAAPLVDPNLIKRQAIKVDQTARSLYPVLTSLPK